MVKIVSGALLAGFVSLALVGTASAQPAAPDVNDVEFKCMQQVNKAGAKFTGAKAKCVSKCLGGFWKVPPLNPQSDCLPPYGGATATCIADPLKGAEVKFANAIKKACDPNTKVGTDCPECYSGGDCADTGEASNRVQNIEGQIDGFVPGVACERAGAAKEEQKCMLNTAKTLSKYVGAATKCYSKCYQNSRKGLAPTNIADCNPFPADAATATCVTKAFDKSVAGVDKKCRAVGESGPGANDGTIAVPDCGMGTNNYNDGFTWTNLVDFAVNTTLATTFCDSPSGAFVD
jgi:hypothetical protein